MVKKVESKEEFDQIINSGNVAFIDFYADWCGPCKMISPIFEKHEKELGKEGVEFYKVNVDDLPEVTEACGIRAMPTFHVYKNGERIDVMAGANPPMLQAFVQKGLGLV